MDHFTLRIRNDSRTVADDHIYLLGKGQDPDHPGTSTHDTVQAFLRFTGGVGKLEQVSAGTRSADYSYPLSSFRQPDGSYALKLPPTTSGRLYLSIGTPLEMHVAESGDGKSLTVAEPDPFALTDPNYYTLYDKIEYTYTTGAGGGVWINTTAVDFFALPLSLSMNGRSVGLAQPREAVLKTLGAQLTGEWSKLVLAFTNQKKTAVLRVVAPNKAIGRPDASQNFDEHYLDPYIRAVWNHYRHNSVGVDCSELLAGTDAVLTGTVSADGTKFHFVNKAGSASADITPIPSSNDVFGAGGSLAAHPKTAQSVVVREFASAMNVGLLPAPGCPTLSQAWLKRQTYYAPNPLLPATVGAGPWYNLYAKALHGFKGADGSSERIYAFAYDDALGQDSTLSTSRATDTATLTLGDLTGTVLPDLKDTAAYDITFHTPGGGEGSIVNPADHTTHRLPPGTTTVTKVTSPFTLTWKGRTYSVAVLTGQATPPFPGLVVAVAGTSASVTLPA